jgi:selenocysteine-specific elongation factor
VGDSLIIAPRGLEVRVRSLHVQNENAQRAMRGDRCGINLTGADLRRHDIHRGDWLVAPALGEASQRLGVRLRVAASETRVLRDNTPVHLHLGASDIGARVGLPVGASIAPGEEALVQLTLDAPALAVRGDRFVIRDQAASRTLGGGEVLEAVSFPARLSRVKRLPLWRALDAPEPLLALSALSTAEPEGVPVEWFARNANLPESAVLKLAEGANLDVLLSTTGAKLMLARARVSQLLDALLETLATHHAAQPERTGLPEQELSQALPCKASPEILRVLTDRLVREARVLRRSGYLCLPNHTPTLAPADERLLAKVTAELGRHGRQAPALHDIPAAMNLTIEVLKPFMERMARLGHLHHVGRYRYYLPETLRELAFLAEELALASPEQRFTAADYKQHTGIGRNVTIEVLEYFDRIGLTRRLGQVRLLRRSVMEALGG